MVSTDRTSQRRLHTPVQILSYFIDVCTYLPNTKKVSKKGQRLLLCPVMIWSSGHSPPVSDGMKSRQAAKDGRKNAAAAPGRSGEGGPCEAQL